MLTMMLGGLWHGASWNFVLWGTYHGALLAIYHWYRSVAGAEDEPSQDRSSRLWTWVWILLYFQLTCLGWLVFRIHGLEDIATKMSTVLFHTRLRDFWSPEGGRLLLYAIPFVCFEAYQYATGRLEPWRHWPAILRTLWYAGLIFMVAMFPEVQTPFIYFQF
jgi:alginate O-acetyltransferase complex protein AlgI